MVKAFHDLSEQEILALAISQEEDDGRIYGEFAERLRGSYPATAASLEKMQGEESAHRHRLIEAYRARFGEHIPLIRRGDVKGWARRPWRRLEGRALAPAQRPPAPRGRIAGPCAPRPLASAPAGGWAPLPPWARGLPATGACDGRLPPAAVAPPALRGSGARPLRSRRRASHCEGAARPPTARLGRRQHCHPPAACGPRGPGWALAEGGCLARAAAPPGDAPTAGGRGAQRRGMGRRGLASAGKAGGPGPVPPGVGTLARASQTARCPSSGPPVQRRAARAA